MKTLLPLEVRGETVPRRQLHACDHHAGAGTTRDGDDQVVGVIAGRFQFDVFSP